MSDVEALRQRIAEVIWNASRADEGTISATGANIVADALIASFDPPTALDLLDRVEELERERPRLIAYVHDRHCDWVRNNSWCNCGLDESHERAIRHEAVRAADALYARAEAAEKREADLRAGVRALADEWRYKGEFGWGPWQEGHGPDIEGQVLDDCARRLRALLDGKDQP